MECMHVCMYVFIVFMRVCTHVILVLARLILTELSALPVEDGGIETKYGGIETKYGNTAMGPNQAPQTRA